MSMQARIGNDYTQKKKMISIKDFATQIVISFEDTRSFNCRNNFCITSTKKNLKLRFQWTFNYIITRMLKPRTFETLKLIRDFCIGHTSKIFLIRADSYRVLETEPKVRLFSSMGKRNKQNC